MKRALAAVIAALFSVLSVGIACAQVAQVAEVVINGNHHVSSDTILSVLRTKVGADFSETEMKADLERIRRLGYFYEESVAAAHEPVAGGERVTFTVEEHPVVQKIVFTGNKVLTEADLRKVISTKVGEVMKSDLVANDVDAIVKLYQQRGYQALVGVADPEQMITRDGTLTVPIIEVVVDKILITGNHKTKTTVIRREMRTRPGDTFNVRKLQRDLERIYNLDLFEEVGPPQFEAPDPPEPGRMVIHLPVKEKKTGQISLALGYSSPQGLVGRIELSETDFRGRGEGINTLLEVGGTANRTSYEVGFFEPYIDRHHTSASLSIFNKVIYRFANSVISGPSVGSNNDLFNEIRVGGELTLTRPLSDTQRAVIGLRTENVHLNLTTAEATNPSLPDFVRQEGRISTLSLRDIRDTRDIIIDPARGFYYTADVDLGSADVKPNVKGNFTKYSLDLRRYLSHGVRKTPTQQKTVWAARLLLGTEAGKVPFSEQFFVGGAETLRGYLESRFWGPHMFLANFEYRKPIAKAFEGVAFVDVGDAWGTHYLLPASADPSNRFRQHSSMSPKVGTGLGVRITTPIGPLRLDWGFGSEGSRAHFSIGHVF